MVPALCGQSDAFVNELVARLYTLEGGDGYLQPMNLPLIYRMLISTFRADTKANEFSQICHVALIIKPSEGRLGFFEAFT